MRACGQTQPDLHFFRGASQPLDLRLRTGPAAPVAVAPPTAWCLPAAWRAARGAWAWGAHGRARGLQRLRRWPSELRRAGLPPQQLHQEVGGHTVRPSL